MLSNLLNDLRYSVRSLAVMAAIGGVLGLAAALMLGRLAARVDPVVALRSE